MAKKNLKWSAFVVFRLLPSEPCLSEGCTCTSDADCPGPNGAGRCVACNCMECPVSVGKDVVNPPLTFVIDTTRQVSGSGFYPNSSRLLNSFYSLGLSNRIRIPSLI